MKEVENQDGLLTVTVNGVNDIQVPHFLPMSDSLLKILSGLRIVQLFTVLTMVLKGVSVHIVEVL